VRSIRQPFNAKPQKLPSAVRQQMERFFRADFSTVSYQIGPEPLSIGARAFAQGDRIVFAPGAFDPGSPSGFNLLVHELTHILQQRSKGQLQCAPEEGVFVDDALEEEASYRAKEATYACIRPLSTAIKQHQTLQLGHPLEVCRGSHQIAVGFGKTMVGSVFAHEVCSRSIEITDLHVQPRFRKQNLGKLLIHAALQTGELLSKRSAVLVSADSGTDKLSRWYEKLGFQRSTSITNVREYTGSIARLLQGVPDFHLSPLCGHPIQCANDDARRAARQARFATGLAAQGEDRLRAAENKELLRQQVLHAYDALVHGAGMTETNSARKHGDAKASETFTTALVRALYSNRWDLIEGEIRNGGDLVITVLLGGRNTATAVFGQNLFTIIHSGATASGVGYGTNLG
jgi:ribosomal protein S18 acetylase RimI-like enzyme